jgi:hypothetical protein
LTRLAGALPPGVRLAELTRSERLTVTIETTEPDRLRAALSRAPGMSTTRTTGEVALADGGYRVTLEQAGEAADGARTGPLPSPTSLVALARDQSLLIESVSVAGRGGIELTVSGREAGVLAFAGLVERGRPAARHARWTLTALPDGGLRLTTRIIGADRPAAAMPLPNCLLFATVAPAPVAGDAPALAGIVGRLPDDAVALVRGVDGRAVSVAPGGDAPGGWRLEALSPDAAIFTRGQERARVPLPPE